MPVFNHVLAATDFSADSTHALRSAAELSSRLGARLSVVHVVPPPPYPYPVPQSEAEMEIALGRLENEVASLGGGAARILRAGPPAAEIVSAARELGADLIIIGSRGRRGVQRALLGSVAESVVRLSPIPVLTMHAWHFDDRAQAARELGAATAHLRAAAPAVIAISRGALVIAAEVGRRLDEKPDLLLATSVGRDGVLLGGICEDGTVRLDPEEIARAPRDPERDIAFARAKSALTAESTALRGSQWIGDVWHRAVVLVSDTIDEPWSILAACDALRRQGASHVTVAAPVATWIAAAALEGVVDRLIVLHTTDGSARGSESYRDARPMSASRPSEHQTQRKAQRWIIAGRRVRCWPAWNLSTGAGCSALAPSSAPRHKC